MIPLLSWKSLFTPVSSPFNPAKFTAFMLLLAAITTVSLLPAISHDADQAMPQQGGAETPGVVFDLQRYGIPADELSVRLTEIGIPWFLRRAGVTGQVDESDANQTVVNLTWNGKDVGRYIERVQPIDADRTRLYIAFEPRDMALVRGLAAPIDTSLDPVGLLRVTLVEHVRSSIDGNGFQLDVLKRGTYRTRMDAAISAFRSGPARNSDDFTLSGSEAAQSAIRRAYRNEAQRAGAAAPGL